MLYNTTTHSMVTPAEIAAGGTGWMLLDEEQYTDYQHPAYYNLGSHFVVDSSGAPSNGWMLTSYSGGGGHDHGGSDDHAGQDDHADHDHASVGEPHDDHASSDAGHESGSEMVLYNTTTHSMVTPAEIAAGGTSWMLLDEEQYPDYQHPAYYNYVEHFAVDSSGAPSNGCLLYTSDAADDP